MVVSDAILSQSAILNLLGSQKKVLLTEHKRPFYLVTLVTNTSLYIAAILYR